LAVSFFASLHENVSFGFAAAAAKGALKHAGMYGTYFTIGS
jgi:hypothetical protein